MALDLFANFERASNNSVFYRPIASEAHEVLFRLIDSEIADEDLINFYQAEYSLNGSSTRIPMIDLRSCQLFDRQTSATYSFTVYVSSLSPVEYVGTYTLSAKYVNSIPQADFIVYPTYRIDETTGTILTLNSTNYHQTSGAYFYGEGHTETINLSANYSTANWYIGNQLSAIEGQQSSVPITTTGGQTATASITSSLALEKSYDISLRITSSDIQLTGPIYTYDDNTGTRSFYPFFCSTLHISNSASELNHILRSPITIKSYPVVQNYNLISQLSGTPISLPYNFDSKKFLARISSNGTASPFLTESFYATQWEIQAVADAQEPNPDWSIVTPLYPSVTGYSFPLSYYEQNNINDFLFKCSAGFNTTITTTVSARKSTIIDLPPNDWLCRTTKLVLSSEEVVVGMPVGRFYTSSYYYLTGEEIKLYNITEPRSNTTITRIVVSSDLLAAPIIFDADEENNLEDYQTISFNNIGVVDLSVTTYFLDQENKINSTVTVLENFIEILPYYDQIEESSYRSMETAPSSLTESYPKISPNEWVTENNINSIFYKFEDALNELRAYARQYNINNPIIGRLESASDNIAACLGKYCLDWRWNERTRQNSSTFTTWKNTKQGEEYSALWLQESCEAISSLNCGRDDHWITPTIEPNRFEEWICISENEDCKYTGIARLNGLDKIVVAYKTELHLLDNDYYASFLGGHPHYFIDDALKFVNVVGLCSTTDDKIVVLDSTLSRVSVYSVNSLNGLTLFTTWGRYGAANNKIGFNKPQDLHVDGSNNVWVCDTGNECVKKLTLTGRHIMTVQNAVFEDNAPISICVDSDNNLHCLAEDSKIYVFDSEGNFAFSYSLPEGVVGIKINCSYEKKETIYITYNKGILKYFKNGVFSHYIIQDYQCSTDGSVLEKFSSIVHDRYRNLYVTLNNTIVKIIDRMTIDEVSYESYAIENLWSLNSILIDKEEYI